jgi:hypothetical protein
MTLMKHAFCHNTFTLLVSLIAHLTTLSVSTTNQNLIHEKIKGKLNSDNACYHSVENILSRCLLSKNSKFKIHKIYYLLIGF